MGTRHGAGSALASIMSVALAAALAFPTAALAAPAGDPVGDDAGGGGTASPSTISADEGASPLAGNVASIGQAGYATLADAFGAANDGDTIVLEADATVGSTIAVDKAVTLDLNGHMISNVVEGDRPFSVTASSFTVDGATAGSGMMIPEENTASYGFIKLMAPSVVTLNGGTYTGDTDNGAFVQIRNRPDGESADGSAASGSTVVLNACTMASNGVFFNTDTLSTDANTPTLQVTGGTYFSEGKAFGTDTLYRSPVTFTNVTVTAGAGPCIEVCGPAATFTDCTFTVTGENPNGFGATAVAASYGGLAVLDGGIYSGGDNGYGVYVYSTGGSIVVKNGIVSGGKAAVKADKGGSNPGVQSTVTVEGGQTVGLWIQSTPFEGETTKLTAEGGIHTADVTAYLADGVKMTSVTTSQGNTVYGVALANNVASYNGAQYETVNQAIEAATRAGGSNATITLLADTYEDVTIPTGAVVTIDLAGHTLTNVQDDTITNNGTLTVVDSSEEKTGTVDNLTHGKAALWNEVGATATLNAGTFVRSMENGISSTDNGGNSYYAVLNHGTMTINDGASVVQDGHYSSLLENGWQSGGQNTTGAESILTINGGTFAGGLNTIKNDDYGNITIKGGTFSNTTQAAVLNWNVASIEGGTFESSAWVVLNGKIDDAMDKGELTIAGGSFTAGEGYTVLGEMDSNYTAGSISVEGGAFYGEIAQTSGSHPIEGTELTITGGSFSESPEAYLHPGYAARVGDLYEVLQRGNLPAGTYVTAEDHPLSSDDLAGGCTLVDNGDGTYTVYRPYVPPAEPTYGSTVAEAEGGTVEVSPERARAGAEVTIAPSPDEGREVRGVAVADSDGNPVEVTENADGTYSFEMPEGGATVTVTFGCDGGTLCPSHGFSDVDQGQWCHDAIDWAVEQGVLNGIGGTDRMEPNSEITRAQMAQVLFNIEGAEAGDASFLSAYADADASAWYADALSWAVSEGIFSGWTEGDASYIDPEGELTREQAAAVLMRWTDMNGGDVAGRADLSGYPDEDSVSEWATEAVQWAVDAGVISGVAQTDGTLLLDGQGTATRAQTAQLMMRLMEGEGA